MIEDREDRDVDEATAREPATPRPWFAHFNAHGDPSIVTDQARPGFTQIAELSTMPDDYGRANALLIESAVNAYDRLRAIEAAARAVTSQAEADDNFEGEYIDYLVPFAAIAALRRSLSEVPSDAR